MTDRKRGPDILVDGKLIKDDKEPHIDEYGLASIESLMGSIETHCVAHDDRHKSDLEKIHGKLQEFLARYENPPREIQMFIVGGNR